MKCRILIRYRGEGLLVCLFRNWIYACGGALAVGGIVAGHSAFAPLLADRDGERRISLRNIHTKETISVIYKRNGKYQPEAMKRINWVLRDWRRNAPTRMDPRLIDLAWEIHTELGSRLPINVISGYRSPKTNAMLRRTRGGQARRSQHILGKAMDVQFPDVPVRRLRYSALIRERGGVGYYPTSATPFVHIDTGRVRHWPRMGRYELALLFPDGRTKHRPRGGGPITRKDVRIARRRHRETAQRVAAFHSARSTGRSQTIVASASPAVIGAFATSIRKVNPPRPVPAARPPSLVGRPRLIDRPSRLVPGPGPSEADRRALTRLAAFAAAPRVLQTAYASAGGSPAINAPVHSARSIGRPAGPVPQAAKRRLPIEGGSEAPTATTWVRAPEYDEEHPEELSYRPFPILPFLTLTASPHDPALAQMVHPDTARTLELLNDEGSVPPLRLRPGAPMAQMLWAQAFSGKAVALSEIRKPPRQEYRGRGQRPLPNRTVATRQ